MATPPTPTLPDPQLAAAALAAQRALDAFERGLLDRTYRGTSGNIVAVSDGTGVITSLVVPAARIPSTGPDLGLAEAIRQALHGALGTLRSGTNQDLDAAVPVIPSTIGQHPRSIGDKVSTLLHAPWTGTAAAGQVSVTVALDWTPMAVVIAGPFYRSPDRLQLGERVREAANAALATSRRELVCAAAALAHPSHHSVRRVPP